MLCGSHNVLCLGNGLGADCRPGHIPEGCIKVGCGMFFWLQRNIAPDIQHGSDSGVFQHGLQGLWQLTKFEHQRRQGMPRIMEAARR
jgi:hypothetical protein